MKYSVNVNLNEKTGKIKPMHCINNVPAFYAGDLYKALSDAGVPLCRMHDTFVYRGADKMVDIPKIFPDFTADENDEKSYDFAMTDALFSEMTKYNLKPFYRLGTSIENYQCVKPYYIYPPKDNLKWAKICEHVIKHYNDGWANGFHYNIEYWEIWNEPENFQEIEDNQMWKGTPEQFYELYRVSASYLKERFPSLKFGGYASCGFYAIFNEKSEASAKVSSRTQYFIDYFENFLKYISDEKHKAPLDFFSWHSYSAVERNIKYAEFCRKTLDKFGYTKTEHYLNEWNPGIMNRGTLADSSNILANMLALQDTSLDMLMYYDGKIDSVYCGLFNPLYAHLDLPIEKKLFKAYYSFVAFNELYKIGEEVYSDNNKKPVFSVCAYNGKSGALLITNNCEETNTVEINGIKEIKQANIISEEKDFQPVKADSVISLKPYETILLKF